MEKDQAVFLCNCLNQLNCVTYDITPLKTVGGTLPKFHQWTNTKKTLAGFEVFRPSSQTGYFLLFIDWHRKGNYYLVIYAHDKSTTLAEMQKIEEIDGISFLAWRYNPLKRDGKNAERKAYFKQMFGNATVQLKLPTSGLEAEDFLNQLFKLCQNRIHADRIVSKFHFDT